MSTFNEADHPRKPKGVSGGGQFAEKPSNAPSQLRLGEDHPPLDYHEYSQWRHRVLMEEGSHSVTLRGQDCYVDTFQLHSTLNGTSFPDGIDITVDVDSTTRVQCRGRFTQGIGYQYVLTRPGHPLVYAQIGGSGSAQELTSDTPELLDEEALSQIESVHYALTGLGYVPEPTGRITRGDDPDSPDLRSMTENMLLGGKREVFPPALESFTREILGWHRGHTPRESRTYRHSFLSTGVDSDIYIKQDYSYRPDGELSDKSLPHITLRENISDVELTYRPAFPQWGIPERIACTHEGVPITLPKDYEDDLMDRFHEFATNDLGWRDSRNPQEAQ